MEGQRERTNSRRRQRRKSKGARSKVVIEPVLIAARRPDSPRLEHGGRSVVASANPKGSAAEVRPARSSVDAVPVVARSEHLANEHVAANGHLASGHAAANGHLANGHAGSAYATGNGHGKNGHLVDTYRNGYDHEAGFAGAQSTEGGAPVTNGSSGIRRRAARIVKVTDNALTPGNNREQQLIERLLRSQGRGAISRAANDLWESKFVAPKRQDIQIQLLEHENEHRARDAVFAIAELLQREAPIQRPVLDQRLRRLETSAEDPITRDAAGALRRSMRVHHGL